LQGVPAASPQLVGQAGSKRDDLQRRVRDELVAVIDEGQRLIVPIFGAPHHGPLALRREKTAAFLEVVFGSAERQRFSESYEVPNDGVTGFLREQLGRLADLRDDQARWELRVDAECLYAAIDERRSLSESERIVAAAAPPTAQTAGRESADMRSRA
jgi:hypothetical protein